MFGVANQLLACAALAVGTTVLLRTAPKKSYALVTMAPLLFVGTTTIAGGIQSIRIIFVPMMNGPDRFKGILNAAITGGLLVCVCIVLVGSALKWLSLVRAPIVRVETA